MEVLITIKDSDVGLDAPTPDAYDERVAARALIFNEKGEVALLYSRTHEYHALPGGGVKEGETLFDALHREAKEEAGCQIRDITELCVIEEFRNQSKIHELSHFYITTLDGEPGESEPEDYEIEEEYQLIFVDIDSAIEKVKTEKPRKYTGNFAVRRNVIALQEAKKALNL